MHTITRIILKLWTSVLSIFGNTREESERLDDAGFHRTIIVGFRLAGRLLRFDTVTHRDDSGGYQCAILGCLGSSPFSPRMLQQVAAYLAHDYFHRRPESLSWIYIPYGPKSKVVLPEDVLEFQFVARGTEGGFRVAWSEAAPEVAHAWIDRTALALEFGRRIHVR